MAIKQYCNPPNGSAYGFPKELPNDVGTDIEDWLISEGYPEHEITSRGEQFESLVEFTWQEDV